MRKIAVALSKGGVGKTTTAVSLSHGLSRAGRRVLLIDLDTQNQCAHALGVAPQRGIAELIDGTTLEDTIIEARPGLHLLAGGRSLAGLKREIARRDFGSEMVLAEALEPAKNAYDYIILDTAPSFDVLNVNALFYVDEVLAPVSLEALSVKGLVEFSRTLRDIQRYSDTINLRYILPTFYDRRLRQSDEVLGQLRTYFGAAVLEPIRVNVRLSEAPGHGQTIFEYAPDSHGAADYQNVIDKVLHDG